MDVAQLQLALPTTALLVLVIAVSRTFGRSPHTDLRAEDLPVRLGDVVGASTTKRDVSDTLNLFLNHVAFRAQMGGSARRGVVLEAAPGTGTPYLAKAFAADAAVPFFRLLAH